jgi:hypothetical protein
MSGGWAPDSFIFEHFAKKGEHNQKTKCWQVQCRYCPNVSPTIKHRDSKCLEHLVKFEHCPNVPEDICKEACQLLMAKAGITTISLEVDDEPTEDSTI